MVYEWLNISTGIIFRFFRASNIFVIH
jgi:hypothetical protein